MSHFTMISENNDLEDFEKNSLDNMDMIKHDGKIYGFRKNVYHYLTDFSKNTKLYGFHYMGEPKRLFIEKLYWFTFIFISFCISASLFTEVWTKWYNSPSFTLSQISKPIWQVPFPAITICSETKARQRVYNFTHYYHKVMDQMVTGEQNLTPEELQKFSDSSLICDNHLYTAGNKTTSHETIEHLMSIAPPLSEIFFGCKWTILNETCPNLFSPMLTEDGICFTFNMLDRSEFFTNSVFLPADYLNHDILSEGWTFENGYPKGLLANTFPRRAMTSGIKSGLFLLLRAYEQDLDYVCRGPVQGYKVFLHHPAEIPQIGDHYFRVPLNQEVVVSVKPELTTTAETLKKYEPSSRQCYFSKERNLKFFQHYTQENCQLECFANYTLDKCDCVAYHMPHDKVTKICGPGSATCMFEAKQQLVQSQVEDDNTPNCNCLPACTSISYGAEISQADFNWPKVFQGFKTNFSEFPGIQLSRLTIFFKNTQFTASERTELYTTTEFLAVCGGLLALCSGFSFLTVAEIIYFLSLRLICNIKKNGTRFWSGFHHKK